MLKKSESGFTLVELAIVMIIIGLLIGGVLKGQELVGNAQITATVAQVKGYDAATTTFRDKYDALPGDIVNAPGRLPTCTYCFLSGNGNGRLDGAPFFATGIEPLAFFPHLTAADLISGGLNDAYVGTTTWSAFYPEAKIRGGFLVGYHPGGALGANTGGAVPGHYLTLTLSMGLWGPAAGSNLTGIEALRIDRKMDDAQSTSGSVFATQNSCTYNELGTNANCDLHIRFQN